MSDIPTIQFEALKDGFSQLQSGSVKITFTLNPIETEAISTLLLSPMGQRYHCVLVEVGPDEKPVEPKKVEWKRSQRAYQLCKGQRFQAFLFQKWPGYWYINEDDGPVEISKDEMASIIIKDECCRISSRSELDTNKEAAARFDALVAEFERTA